MLARPVVHNVPQEMKERKQWCVTTLEPIADDKLDKAPYNPKTGEYAYSTESDTWSDFQTCVDAVVNGTTNFRGVPFRAIGYCIADDDNLTCFDLDDYFINPTEEQRQIATWFGTGYHPSYGERSQSGTGAHIWVHGKAGSYVNHSMGIEIYDRQRFIVCTGDCPPSLTEINPNDFSDTIKQIAAYMKMKPAEPLPNVVWSEANEPDNVIIGKITGAKTWPKIAPYAEFGYPSNADKSAVDIEIAGHIAGFTQSPYQFVRIFQTLFPRCWRPEKRKTEAKYIEDYLINRTFGKVVASDQAKNAANMAVHNSVANAIAKMSAEDEGDLPPITAFPPGAVGAMAQLFYDAAPRQVREIALAGALAMYAGFVGRNYIVGRNGLNLYVVATAGTGVGKNAASMGIGMLTRAIARKNPNVRLFQGEDYIASAPGLVKMLKEHPCCFSVLSEFGHLMRNLISQKSGPNDQRLRQVLLDLFTKSGPYGEITTGAYSDRKEKEPVRVGAPAFTFLGDTTPDVYYEAFNSGVAQEGFLPRLLTVSYTGERPKRNANFENVSVPDQAVDYFNGLIEHLIRISGFGEGMENNLKFINIGFDDAAQEIWTRFDDKCDIEINSHASGTMIRTLWTRATEKAQRVAGLIAVGKDYLNPVIDAECMQWGIFLAERDIAAFEYYSRNGVVGSNVTRQLPLIVEWARQFIKMNDDQKRAYSVGEAHIKSKTIPYAYFYKRAHMTKEFNEGLRGGELARVVKAALQDAVDLDYLQRLSDAQKDAIPNLRRDGDTFAAASGLGRARHS